MLLSIIAYLIAAEIYKRSPVLKSSYLQGICNRKVNDSNRETKERRSDLVKMEGYFLWHES